MLCVSAWINYCSFLKVPSKHKVMKTVKKPQWSICLMMPNVLSNISSHNIVHAFFWVLHTLTEVTRSPFFYKAAWPREVSRSVNRPQTHQQPIDSVLNFMFIMQELLLYPQNLVGIFETGFNLYNGQWSNNSSMCQDSSFLKFSLCSRE